MEQKLQSNIWKYTVFLIANKRVFIAILGAYFLTIPDVGPEGIGLLLMAGSLAGFVFEIPSGYVSDKIGHKTALVMSRVFMLTSTIFFLIASSMTLLILGVVFMNMGNAFNSGTGSAFMHETLRGLGKEDEYAQVTGKMRSIGFAVPIVLIVLIPFLVGISFKAPFVIGAIMDIVGVLVAISLVSPKVAQEEIDEIKLSNFKQVMRDGYNRNFFRFALFSGVAYGVMFTAGKFRAPYQMFLEVPVIWFGVLFGIGRALASLVLAYSGKIKEMTSVFSFYRFQLIFYPLLIILLWLIPSWWAVVVIFIIMNASYHGLSGVTNSYLVDVIKTSKFKATLLSVHSQINQIITAITGFSLGFMIERFSYQFGFLYLGVVFFAILFPLYLYIAYKGPSAKSPIWHHTLKEKHE